MHPKFASEQKDIFLVNKKLHHMMGNGLYELNLWLLLYPPSPPPSLSPCLHLPPPLRLHHHNRLPLVPSFTMLLPPPTSLPHSSVATTTQKTSTSYFMRKAWPKDLEFSHIIIPTSLCSKPIPKFWNAHTKLVFTPKITTFATTTTSPLSSPLQ